MRTQVYVSLVLFSNSVMFYSPQPHGLQHTRLPCPSYLLEFAQTHVHWFSDVIQPSHPLSFPSPPASIFPGIRVFSSESVLRIRWPHYWSFSFSISPSSEYSRLISFRIDWFDLLAVQGTLDIVVCLKLISCYVNYTSIFKKEFSKKV